MSAARDPDDLIETLRRQARGRRADPAPDAAPERPRAFDFSTLPDYRPIRLQKAALAELGLGLPFYREAEGSGPVEQVVEGRACVSFSSYDYLGLNRHPEVIAAAAAAAERWGVSASASRLVGGERPCHRRLERALAAMKGTEDCVVMVSGHATNVSTIAALVGPEDLVILDALAHNSMIEGARLSGASRLTMPHADLGWLEETLSRRRGEFRRVLVGVEGLYSMDGDAPDLAALVEIKERHGAWLMVDEAHSVGVLGAGGRGLAEAQGVDPSAVEIWMGTLSKALASCGGYVCGSAALVDFLKARAPGFVFSVGLAPPLAAAAETAIATMLREPERVARLAERGRLLRDSARAAGLDTGLSEGHAVTPVVVGDSLRAVRASAELLGRGVNALPIIHPAVPERAARLRFFVTAEHEPRQIAEAVAATAAVLSAR